MQKQQQKKSWETSLLVVYIDSIEKGEGIPKFHNLRAGARV